MLSSLLQKAGFKPGLALHLTIPNALMAAALIGGAGPLLATGSAHASPNPSSCTFGTASGTCLLNNWNLNPWLIGDKIFKLDTVGTDFGGTTGELNFEQVSSDSWVVNLDFDPIGSSLNTTGQLVYSLAIDPVLGPGRSFETVLLDVTASTPTTNVDKIINGITVASSTNGDPSPFVPISGTTLNVTDKWVNSGNGTLDSIVNTYQQSEVPGPLPLMGAGMAFGFSRKLRNRIKASASAKV